MKSRLLFAPTVLLLVSCVSVGWPETADPSRLTGTPEHFLVLDPSTGATLEPTGPACRNPLVDPRDGTRLVLVRSQSGFGDYQPERPAYGLPAHQLIRVDCSNGRPVGATPGAS
jgi:hypothetical protein